jgi:hypothetical protein
MRFLLFLLLLAFCDWVILPPMNVLLSPPLNAVMGLACLIACVVTARNARGVEAT